MPLSGQRVASMVMVRPGCAGAAGAATTGTRVAERAVSRQRPSSSGARGELPPDGASGRASCPDRCAPAQSVALRRLGRVLGRCWRSYRCRLGRRISGQASRGLPAVGGRPGWADARPGRLGPTRRRWLIGRGRAGGGAARRAARPASPSPPNDDHLYMAHTRQPVQAARRQSGLARLVAAPITPRLPGASPG